MQLNDESKRLILQLQKSTADVMASGIAQVSFLSVLNPQIIDINTSISICLMILGILNRNFAVFLTSTKISSIRYLLVLRSLLRDVQKSRGAWLYNHRLCTFFAMAALVQSWIVICFQNTPSKERS